MDSTESLVLSFTEGRCALRPPDGATLAAGTRSMAEALDQLTDQGWTMIGIIAARDGAVSVLRRRSRAA